MAVDICREVCEKVVMGNWDYISARNDHTFTISAGLQTDLDWHRRKLGVERLGWLSRLPGTIDFTISGRNVRLFHASQKGVFDRVFHDDPVEKHLAMFENTDFTGYHFTLDTVGYADIHYPYRKTYDGKTLFNVGSAGNPLDRPLACYEIMEGEYDSAKPGPFSMSLVRLEYDIEKAVGIAEASGMPEIEAWVTELRHARYRGTPHGK